MTVRLCCDDSLSLLLWCDDSDSLLLFIFHGVEATGVTGGVRMVFEDMTFSLILRFARAC